MTSSTQEIAVRQENSIPQTGTWNKEKMDLLKNTIARDCTPDEFEVFVYICKHSRLDPFLKQIYPVKRYDPNAGKSVMICQTSIDGYRLIADRTGCYAPGPAPTFHYDDKGNFISAEAHVKKLTKDGTWHTISAIAFYDEYVQKKKDGTPTSMWNNMKRSQTAKCAEALALRKAFPYEMSSIRTDEEMQQADVEIINAKIEEKKLISSEQAAQLQDLLKGCPKDFIVNVSKYIADTFGGFEKIEDKAFTPILNRIQSKIDEVEKANQEMTNAA